MACVRKPPDDCRRQHESLALCKSNGTPYQALGGDYCLRRQNPDAQARRLVKGVEGLRHHLQLSDADKARAA
jgi:hypothetical protein